MPRKSSVGIDGVSVTMINRANCLPWLCRVRVPHAGRYIARCFNSRESAIAWGLEARQSHDSPLRIAQSVYINAVQSHYGKHIPKWVQQRIADRAESMFRSIDSVIRLWQKDAPLKSGRSAKRMAWGQKKRMQMAAELC